MLCTGGVNDRNVVGHFSQLFKYLQYRLIFQDLANMDVLDLARMLRFCSKQYQNAFVIKLATQYFVKNFNGRLPSNIVDLISVYGFQHEFASLILECAHGSQQAVPIDVHGEWCSKEVLNIREERSSVAAISRHLMTWVKEEQRVLVNDLLGGYSQMLASHAFVRNIVISESKNVSRKCDLVILGVDSGRNKRAEARRAVKQRAPNKRVKSKHIYSRLL
jgi:endonuclease III